MIDNLIEIELSKLVKADWNYKTNDPEMLAILKRNLKRNGQIENIIVRELPNQFYEVVNGNHRYDALVELGINKAVCYNLGNITQEQAVLIAIETNETNFTTDNIKLGESLNSLIESGVSIKELLETLPYDETYLQNLLELPDFDWDSLNTSKGEGSGTGGEDKPKENKITIVVPKSVYDMWVDWLDKYSEKYGNNPAEAFNYAIADALLIPKESLK